MCEIVGERYCLGIIKFAMLIIIVRKRGFCCTYGIFCAMPIDNVLRQQHEGLFVVQRQFTSET